MDKKKLTTIGVAAVVSTGLVLGGCGQRDDHSGKTSPSPTQNSNQMQKDHKYNNKQCGACNPCAAKNPCGAAKTCNPCAAQ